MISHYYLLTIEDDYGFTLLKYNRQPLKTYYHDYPIHFTETNIAILDDHYKILIENT